MKRIVPAAFLSLILLPPSFLFAEPPSGSALSAPNLAGIWENKSRFVEFAGDGRMRIVLKPYYGFVYEDSGWIPWTETETAASTGSAPSDPENPVPQRGSVVNGAGVYGQSDGASSGTATELSFATAAPSIHSISVKYAGEKYEQLVPAAIIGDGMFFRFYRKVSDADGGASVVSVGGAAGGPSLLAAGEKTAAGAKSVPAETLSGFWLASGNSDAIRLYRSEPVKEFFSYYFDGSRYYRIRYWESDARWKNLQATFAGAGGKTLSVPKFIPMGGVLYTCVTSTGIALRNLESGTFALKDGFVKFSPENVAFEGTAAAVANPLRVSLSDDGAVLALGEPYLLRSKVSDLDAEIKAHNGLRRPPRKPIFGYMDLDFRWDEIDRIRNNGKSPE